MDLRLTDEQQALADTARDICRATLDSEQVRRAEIEGRGFPDEFRRAFGDSGLAGIDMPEELGGAGAGLVETCIVAEQLGRAAGPIAPLISSVLAGGLIAAHGRAHHLASWPEAIATGDKVVSVAWLEQGGGFAPADIRLRVGADSRLSGTKILVPFPDEADAFVVPVRTDDGNGADGIGLLLLGREAVTAVRQQRTMAGEALGAVLFDAVISDDDWLSKPGIGWEALHDAMERTVIVLAAYAAGGARAVLEMATDYARERRQFDRPIGANQGIAHPLADTLVSMEGASTLAYHAAWAHDSGRDIRILAPMAKKRCCAVFRDAAAVAHQVYGGIGFTVDVDVQLYSRRAKQLQLLWWDNRTLDRILGEMLLGPEGPGPLPSLISR